MIDNPRMNKYDNVLDILPVGSGSGDIVYFEDGAADMPLKSMIVNIDPVQSGNGDPSPENIRAISGWTKCKIQRTGANLWNDEHWRICNWALKGGTGTYKDFYNGYTKSISNYFTKAIGRMLLKEMNLGRIMISATRDSNRTTLRPTFYYSDRTNDYVSNQNEDGNFVRVSSANKTCIGFCMNTTAGPNNKDVYLKNFQIRRYKGSSAFPAEEDHSAKDYDISWQNIAGTIFGGLIDVPGGKIRKTWEEIASYNGETLPGRWISDRDVYSEGTTPTIGAQVVYELETPQDYQIEPIEIYTLRGENNIWAQTGDVFITYFKDIDLVLGNIENRLAALEG